MSMRVLSVGAVVAVTLSSSLAAAQDLYDTATLRSFNLTFHDANWLTLLRNNYASETMILADLEVDGTVYPDVGVRIRGNTSYTGLPAGSEKFSLKIEMDFVHADQDLLGYDTLNLNNGFRDPTFCREVVYNNFVAQYIPNPRANHALVTLNGANWGVYINVQQPDKTMLRDFFTNADGLRIRCANNPNGPGLRYNGTNPASYAGYEIQNDGGLADPLGSLIAVCNALTNEPLATWPNIDQVFAIDPSIWSVVLENLLTDDDSYVNKGCDFMTYTDPLDGRMHLLQRDANETFTQTTWSVTRNFTNTNRPVLNRVLAVSELRQRYMAHYRTAAAQVNWSTFGAEFTTLRTLIDAHVQADPKKLYSYTLFQNNFTSTVTMPYAGFAGGTIIGLEQFINQRASFLATNTELMASGPIVSNVAASDDAPLPGDVVSISALALSAGSPVTQVELFWRVGQSGVFARTTMADDGLSGDGAAGDGVYGAVLPVLATGGERVEYYVAATAGNAFSSLTFAPALAERGPASLEFGVPAAPGMRITEFMYSGTSGEFVELTNRSALPIDLTGWSMDDDHAVAGAFDLSALGIVQPGASVIITESDAASFRLAWNIDPQVAIAGQLGIVSGNNLGRNDQIHLFDDSGALIDRLDYGDQTFAGTIRTQNASGQVCRESLGTNAIDAWVLSTVGDEFGSVASATGDLGSPGVYIAVSCLPCPADLTGDGMLDFFDMIAFLAAFAAQDPAADFNDDGQFDFFDITTFLTAFGEGCP